ncbi:PDZ domain-containing protein [Vulcanisaeta distributa]|uniref:PDZ domain-containing protein n=1 Tax=Vulcanisaeta distributa TaxID=164451 RepID=UPI001FB1BD5A|nr:PDZ domain-containing protein [Vulcanisaeta distributa]
MVGSLDRDWAYSVPTLINPPWLGTLDYPWRRGVLVVKVLPGSPADDAGIRQGDIITAIDDEELSSIVQLKVHMTRKFIEGNRAFDLTIVRGGRTRYRIKVSI